MAQNYPQTPPPAFDAHSFDVHATPNATYQYPGADGQQHGIGQPQEHVAGATEPFYGHGGDEQKAYYGTQQLPQQYPPHTYPMQQQQQSQQHYQQEQRFLQVVPIQALSRASAPVDCPICGQRGLTSVKYETGSTTHVWALVACLVACLGCIPYLMTSLKDVQHLCGNCGTLLAVWHRSGNVEVVVHPQG